LICDTRVIENMFRGREALLADSTKTLARRSSFPEQGDAGIALLSRHGRFPDGAATAIR
jgi:hypothetical protein